MNNEEIDMYLGGLTSDQSEELKKNENIRIVTAPTQPFSLSLNLAIPVLSSLR